MIASLKWAENHKISGNEGPISFQPKGLLDTSLAYLGETTGKKWLLTLVDQGIVSATSFLTTVILGRASTKEQLGLYFLGMSIVSFMMELQNVLIWSPYTALSPQFKGSTLATYTGSTFLHQWCFSVVSVPALGTIGFLLSYGWGPPGLDSVIWILALIGFLICFREYARRISFARFQIITPLVFDSFSALFQCSALLLLAYLGRLSAVPALVIIGTGAFFACMLWYPCAHQGMKLSWTAAVSDFSRNWSFGRWILGGNLALFLSCQTFPWFLANMHGTEILGALVVCQGVVGLANPFLQGTTNFLAPKAAQTFAQEGVAALRTFALKSTIVIVSVTTFFCIGIIIFGSDLVTFIYGPQYTGLGLVIALLSLNILISAISIGVDYGLWAIGRPDVNFKIEILRLFITFTIGLWLVKSFSLMGVAWGLLIGSIAIFVFKGAAFIGLTAKGYLN